MFFFFFQAEDGIRDIGVTGVQTCALPIFAQEIGLDAAESRAVIESDAYADAVRADANLAREYGIQGVPFFVIGGKYGVSGAQPSEKLLEILEKAWSENEA